MKMQNHWIKDVSSLLEDLEHGDTIQKFVAKSDKDEVFVNGGPALCVEIHGFITSSGEFIIVSERFEQKEDKT